jgi:hypothetical protein
VINNHDRRNLPAALFASRDRFLAGHSGRLSSASGQNNSNSVLFHNQEVVRMVKSTQIARLDGKEALGKRGRHRC